MSKRRLRKAWLGWGMSLVLPLLLAVCVPAHGTSRGLQVVDPAGKTVGLYSGSYALVIGVSDYTNGWPDLPGVVKDIEAVKSALEAQGFEVITVRDPTLLALHEAFDTFIARYGLDPENRLLFYFAGHGHTLPLYEGIDEYKLGYIVPADAPNPHQDPKGFRVKAMDMQQIEVYARRIQAKHALFVFDSCFSGAGLFGITREAPPRYISEKTAKPVRQFITSGNENETVPDESIFRRQFLAALEGQGDANGDGYLTGTELSSYLSDNVINYSGGRQHPLYGKLSHPALDKGDFVFKITVTVTTSPNAKPQVDVTTQFGETATPSLESRHQGGGANPEVEMWRMVKDSPNTADLEYFLQTYPESKFAPLAHLRLQQVERQASLAPTPEPTLPTSSAPQAPSFPPVQIREAQRLLQHAGLDPGPVDGMIGGRTAAALRAYQAQHDLPVTGVPDVTTLQALRAEPHQQGDKSGKPAEIQVAVNIRSLEPSLPRPTPVTSGEKFTSSIGMEFVLIPAGTFLMGSSTGRGDERPVREITLSRPFYLGKYEVTQAQWVEVMGSNPSHFTGERAGGGGIAMAGKQIGGFFRRLGGDRPEPEALKMDAQRPVEMVSWAQVQEFIQRLNAKEGHRRYRLPSEAEWEYAARAGDANFGNDDTQLAQHGWCAPNAGNVTHEVGELPSNPWGLYDMHGNVWEWVSDRYGLYTGGATTDPSGASIGVLRVLRGGAANQPLILCRSVARLRDSDQKRHPFIGFRLAMTAP